MIKAARKTGIVFFPAYDWAITPFHPEREERLLYTQDQLKEEGLFDIEGIDEYKPDIADDTDIIRTHFCFPDVSSVSTKSHMIAAGGAIRAARLVMEGAAERAFAIVRPPGHHAMKVVYGNRGFCNINNEAVMIEFIRENYGRKKIAVVDTDCHHGDGTQDIYWNDPDILFISMHQDGRTLYPGTGAVHELGGPNARGKTINIPLPPGTTDEGFLHVTEKMVLPIIKDFRPDIIINSAGQDNHFSDPITNMNFSASGYAAMTRMLNPHISVLEGGYSIQGALPYVNLGIILAMAGVDFSHVKEPGYAPENMIQEKSITEYITRLSDVVLKNYFFPDPLNDIPEEGVFFHRRKFIDYDTDGIQDSQNEYLMKCGSCSGLLRVESSSGYSVNLGIEIPFGACASCLEEGKRIFEIEKKTRRYKTVQLINRPEKKYQIIRN